MEEFCLFDGFCVALVAQIFTKNVIMGNLLSVFADGFSPLELLVNEISRRRSQSQNRAC